MKVLLKNEMDAVSGGAQEITKHDVSLECKVTYETVIMLMAMNQISTMDAVRMTDYFCTPYEFDNLSKE